MVGWWTALAVVMTVIVGLVPASYEPRLHHSVLLRLGIAVGSSLVLALIAGSIASRLWSPTAGLAAAAGMGGLAILPHHAYWAVAARWPMVLWPGVASAGSGLLVGSTLLGHGPITGNPLALLGALVLLGGMLATYFNAGAGRDSQTPRR
jgi:hypothetical protein